MNAFALCQNPVPNPFGQSTVSARSQQRLRHAVRRGIPFGAGEVNDPEKTAERKEEKKKEWFWAEPKNKNPLEKTHRAHDPELGEEVEKIEGAVEGAIGGIIQKVGETLKKVTGQK